MFKRFVWAGITAWLMIVTIGCGANENGSVSGRGDRSQSETASVQPASVVPVIFDTDMGNDVDDALALGMLHAFQSRGKCELLAVTLSKDHELAASFVDAVNTFYGRGDIPIGVVRQGATPDPGPFLPLAEQQDNGRPRYPHDLHSGSNAPEATGLLRKLLAAESDRSVLMVQVGFSTNLARLLNSEPDEHSPLTGRELIEQKVKLLSMMAGAFQPIGKVDRYLEYNVVQDLASAKTIIHNWPTEIIFSGFEIGIAVPYPAVSIESDFDYAEHHPLAEAYWLYNPPPHNRPTWDLTSVLYAVLPDRDYFELSPPGRVTVEDDGFTQFENDADGKHRYLILAPEQTGRVQEALVQLASQPPEVGADQ